MTPNERLLQFFRYEHLPQPLAEISKKFCDLAYELTDIIESNAELTVGLRKLLESKDCCVRAVIYKDNANG